MPLPFFTDIDLENQGYEDTVRTKWSNLRPWIETETNHEKAFIMLFRVFNTIAQANEQTLFPAVENAEAIKLRFLVLITEQLVYLANHANNPALGNWVPLTTDLVQHLRESQQKLDSVAGLEKSAKRWRLGTAVSIGLTLALLFTSGFTAAPILYGLTGGFGGVSLGGAYMVRKKRGAMEKIENEIMEDWGINRARDDELPQNLAEEKEEKIDPVESANLRAAENAALKKVMEKFSEIEGGQSEHPECITCMEDKEGVTLGFLLLTGNAQNTTHYFGPYHDQCLVEEIRGKPAQGNQAPVAGRGLVHRVSAFEIPAEVTLDAQGQFGLKLPTFFSFEQLQSRYEALPADDLKLDVQQQPLPTATASAQNILANVSAGNLSDVANLHEKSKELKKEQIIIDIKPPPPLESKRQTPK